MRRRGETGSKGEREAWTDETAEHGQQRAGGAGHGWSGSRLPTLNGVDLADGIADSAAEAGQSGCGPLHLGHGVLEPGLKAGQGTRPLTLQPHITHQRTWPASVLYRDDSGGSMEGKLESEKKKSCSQVVSGSANKQENLRLKPVSACQIKMIQLHPGWCGSVDRVQAANQRVTGLIPSQGM